MKNRLVLTMAEQLEERVPPVSIPLNAFSALDMATGGQGNVYAVTGPGGSVTTGGTTFFGAVGTTTGSNPSPTVVVSVTFGGVNVTGSVTSFYGLVNIPKLTLR